MKDENYTLKESLLRLQKQQQQQHVMETIDSSSDTGAAGLLLSFEAQEKLRGENTRMREIYEDHMRVCVNTSARLARKSSSAMLSANQLCEIDELKAQVQKSRQRIDELQRALNDKSNECFTLYEEISRLKHSSARDNLDGNSVSQHAVDR